MSVLKDVSVSELLRMREDEGMSNQQIADSLDVSYQTILRLIGKQPSRVRSSRQYSVPRMGARSCESADDVVASTTHTSAPACLVVEDRTVTLKGTFAAYEIPVRKKCVEIGCDYGSIRVPFDKLDDFVAELSAIQRRLDGLRVENEMW